MKKTAAFLSKFLYYNKKITINNYNKIILKKPRTETISVLIYNKYIV